jgi:hypothetical protein
MIISAETLLQIFGSGFGLLILTQFVKWLYLKLGKELGRTAIQAILFAIALVISSSVYFPHWNLILENVAIIWAAAIGLYEVLIKTLLPLAEKGLTKITTKVK